MSHKMGSIKYIFLKEDVRILEENGFIVDFSYAEEQEAHRQYSKNLFVDLWFNGEFYQTNYNVEHNLDKEDGLCFYVCILSYYLLPFNFHEIMNNNIGLFVDFFRKTKDYESNPKDPFNKICILYESDKGIFRNDEFPKDGIYSLYSFRTTNHYLSIHNEIDFMIYPSDE